MTQQDVDLPKLSARTTAVPGLADPVTGSMRRDFPTLLVDQTIEQALAGLRAEPPSGRIVYFYVVDSEKRLCGVVPTRRLLLSPPVAMIRDIMVHQVVKIPIAATVKDACEVFVEHRLLAIPVVDLEDRIAGVVDVDLYTDELADLDRRQTSDDLFQLIGVHLSESSKADPWSAFTGRFPWLLANIIGGLLAAFLTGMFEVQLQKVVALALFIPVVLALAESVAIQSVSLALQALHGRQPTLESILRKLQTEMLTGLLLGLSCGTVVSLVAVIWLQQWLVPVCLAGGLIGGITLAAVIGVAIPNVLRWLNREPQVAAGPVSLAVTDMVTLLLYFGLARWLIA
ncbi:MAG: magnesium transporter [Planctomycetaceae bacterium]|nr:magnesium transporter [Planctomycetaceae bacterium]